MSSELDARNADWERDLNPWQAELWANMKAAGVCAYWRDPLQGQAVYFTEATGNMERQRGRDEFYEFVVEHRGTVLISSTKRTRSWQATELSSITISANSLQGMGIRVMPQ